MTHSPGSSQPLQPCPTCGRLVEFFTDGVCVACHAEKDWEVNKPFLRIIHGTMLCAEGHRAISRHDPNDTQPKCICLSCAGPTQLIEFACPVCGAYCVSYYKEELGTFICRTGCENGHHYTTRL